MNLNKSLKNTKKILFKKEKYIRTELVQTNRMSEMIDSVSMI